MASSVKLTIKATATSGKNINENFKLNPQIVTGNIDSDTALIIDTFARGIVALTTNAYVNSLVTTEQDIGAIIAE